MTTSYSEGVTIDSTPPVITGSIDVNGGYITTSDHVQASWSGVFIDRESGQLMLSYQIYIMQSVLYSGKRL